MAQAAAPEAPGEKLERSLAELDRSRTPEEYRAQQERICSLGPEVAPNVLEALAKPQDPERFDLLVRLLIRWVRLEEVLGILARPESGWLLRSALAEALRYYADDLHPSETHRRERIQMALASLARDPHDAVRMAAVDAAGLARLAGAPELHPVLRTIAASDPNPSIRQEAEEALRSLG